jgi:hypothetical protein
MPPKRVEEYSAYSLRRFTVFLAIAFFVIRRAATTREDATHTLILYLVLLNGW